MPITLEKIDECRKFGRRLTQALDAALYSTAPIQVTDAFNSRTAERPVTVYAVRKWLCGDSIPTQARLSTLAAWLGVSAQWLRFGDASPAPGDSFGLAYHSLLNDLAMLTAEQNEQVRGLVLILLAMQSGRSLSVVVRQ